MVCVFKKRQKKKELLTYIDMLQMVEKGITSAIVMQYIDIQRKTLNIRKPTAMTYKNLQNIQCIGIQIIYKDMQCLKI